MHDVASGCVWLEEGLPVLYLYNRHKRITRQFLRLLRYGSELSDGCRLESGNHCVLGGWVRSSDARDVMYNMIANSNMSTDKTRTEIIISNNEPYQ